MVSHCKPLCSTSGCSKLFHTNTPTMTMTLELLNIQLWEHDTPCHAVCTYSLAVMRRIKATTVDLVSLLIWPTMVRPR